MDVLAPIRAFDRYQQKHTALAIPMATVKKFGEDRASNLAVIVTYSAIFCIFPLLLVFVTILSYVLAGDHSAFVSVKDSVLSQFPLIGDSIKSNPHGSAVALVVGIVLSFWAGLGVTGAARNAFDTVWAVPKAERAGFVPSKLKGALLLIVLGALFVVAAGASGLVSGGLGGPLLKVAGYVVSILLNLALFMASYQLLCSDDLPWRSLLPGAILASVLWLVLESIGGVYIAHFQHSTTYGNFAVVLGVIAWLHLGTQMMMYCAELNTVLARHAWPKALLGGDEAGQADDEDHGAARPAPVAQPVSE